MLQERGLDIIPRRGAICRRVALAELRGAGCAAAVPRVCDRALGAGEVVNILLRPVYVPVPQLTREGFVPRDLSDPGRLRDTDAHSSRTAHDRTRTGGIEEELELLSRESGSARPRSGSSLSDRAAATSLSDSSRGPAR